MKKTLVVFMGLGLFLVLAVGVLITWMGNDSIAESVNTELTNPAVVKEEAQSTNSDRLVTDRSSDEVKSQLSAVDPVREATEPASTTQEPSNEKHVDVVNTAVGARTIPNVQIVNTQSDISPTKEQITSTVVPSGKGTDGGWMHMALVVMAMATILSVAVSFYLYRWRKILVSHPNATVPEEWSKYLHQVGDRLVKLTETFNSNMQNVGSETTKSTEKIKNMTETFMALQGALDEKDAEIRRLRKGYDAEVFRKFIFRFIRIDQAVDDFLELDEGGVEKLKQVKRLFEDAFDECGVESFRPDIGDDYRKTEGVADNPKTRKTEIEEDEFKIYEVLEAGYRLRAGEKFEFIAPAKVRIFTFDKVGG